MSKLYHHKPLVSVALLMKSALSSLVWVLVLELLLVFLVEPLLLHQRVVDELIVQEFVEPIQLFYQELVEILDDSSHHSDTVCLDRV